MFGRLGWTEILIIVVLVLILFGHNKIPGMMKNLADGVNVFKKEIKDSSDKKKEGVSADVKSVPAAKQVAAKKTSEKKVMKKSASVKKAAVKKSSAGRVTKKSDAKKTKGK